MRIILLRPDLKRQVAGTFPYQDVIMNRNVALIGVDVANKIFKNNEDPLGKQDIHWQRSLPGCWCSEKERVEHWQQ